MKNNDKTAAEQIGETVSAYGKFENAEKLLKAYNALEAEFTKRCQRLKEAESENAKLAAELKTAEESVVRSCGRVDESIAEKIVEEYLASVLSCPSAPVLKSDFGNSALTPVRRPKSLAEAKKLADMMLGK